MTKLQKTNKARFCSALQETAMRNGKTLDYLASIDTANKLHRYEATLSRLAEDECNYPEYDYKKQERYEHLAETLIYERIGCECYTQRDPRGFCIRLYLVDHNGNKFANTFDGETSGCNW